MAGHPFVHIEISAKDLEKAAEFYSDIFGWKVEQMPEMNYATFETGASPGGGFNPVTDDNPAGTVLVYISSDDIDADLQKIEKKGGKTLMPKTVIPQMGWFAVFQDPTGNHMALYTAMNPS